MGVSINILILAAIFLVFLIGIPIALFFIIRYFIRYNAKQKRNKSKRQEELDKMNLEDL